MGRLEDKVAVITGSGRGIGKAMAVIFASEGASIVVSDIDEAPAVEAVKEIEAAGGKATYCLADVRNPKETKKLMDTAAEKFGKLDILVNNAGIIRDAMIHKMTDLEWDLCLDIHLRGAFNCIRAAAPYMMKREHGGRIVNVSSVAGLMGNPGQINYSAAKGGIISLTKTVAKEWKRFKITCNAVAYGGVDTRLTGEKETGDEVFGEKIGIPKKMRDAYINQLTWMTPEQAAKPVLFLVSDDSAFITGHVLNITDGWYM
ncbi:MAG: SDR family NAD(P)-dependent oxidoreductase [Chloroflexota bacterium]|nr:SDR family NAD(P)-dependent oxidoreductase [Chloroflexota bacterium]